MKEDAISRTKVPNICIFLVGCHSRHDKYTSGDWPIVDVKNSDGENNLAEVSCWQASYSLDAKMARFALYAHIASPNHP